MKSQYIKALAFAGVLSLTASCNDNSWNDTFLDGFEGGPTFENAVTVNYTLTSADYETIGKALAAVAQTDEEVAAAKAIQSNHYFDANSPYPSKVAVPYLLDKENTDFYIYNNGSFVNVVLNQAEPPVEVTAINAAPRFIYEETLKPTEIPSLLVNEYPDAQKGDYAIISYSGGASAAKTVSAPTQTVAAKKTVTRADEYWTVATALSKMADGYTGQATVKGIISSIKEISTQYGNATYFLKDNLSDEAELEVYRGYYLNGDKFTSEDQLEVGATVVVTGELVDYNGTYEFTTGSKILSYNGEGSGSGDNNGSGDSGDDEPGDNTGSEKLGDNIKGLKKGDTLKTTAVITAQNASGVVITDNAGSILVYNTGLDFAKMTIGTIVEVDGTVTTFGTGLQLDSSASLNPVGEMKYTYPSPKVYTGEMIDAAAADTNEVLSTYAQMSGKLSISGNYYNVTIAGANVQGSVSYPNAALKAELEDGKYYTFTGYFTGISGSATKYFNMVVTKLEDFTPSVNEDDLVNAIYKYDGSAWVVAPDAVVMNPEDYAALDLNNNKLTDPAIYLPIYLRNKFPYTPKGTKYYVAYNISNGGSACGLVEFDGSNWQYVDSYIKNVTEVFQKTGDGYVYRKRLGQETFKFYDREKIGLNCSYLIVYGGVCMMPVPANKNYGYPGESEVTFDQDMIVQPNGDNAFSFVTSTEYNGNVYTAPEGMFMILDSNGRYMYLQGTYSSFNCRSNNAYIETDGTISKQYLFTASRNDNGTWTIKNEQDITRTLYYSDGNNDFAAYQESDLSRYNGVLPYLYISEASDPDADNSGSQE